MCKAPVKGLVKTRLAADVGGDAALAVYSEMLSYVFEQLRTAAANVAVFVDGGERHPVRSEGPGDHDKWHYLPQCGTSLGERIISALCEAPFAERMLVIGTDMPFIDEELIAKASRALDHSDIVLGPCVDGGYYLIGMKSIHRQLFEEIPWSTSEVLSATLYRCATLNLTAHLLPEHRDVDTLSDLLALYAPAPRHEAFVERLREIVGP